MTQARRLHRDDVDARLRLVDARNVIGCLAVTKVLQQTRVCAIS